MIFVFALEMKMIFWWLTSFVFLNREGKWLPVSTFQVTIFLFWWRSFIFDWGFKYFHVSDHLGTFGLGFGDLSCSGGRFRRSCNARRRCLWFRGRTGVNMNPYQGSCIFSFRTDNDLQKIWCVSIMRLSKGIYVISFRN